MKSVEFLHAPCPATFRKGRLALTLAQTVQDLMSIEKIAISVVFINFALTIKGL